MCTEKKIKRQRGGGGEWEKSDQRKRPHLHRRVLIDERGRVLRARVLEAVLCGALKCGCGA